MAACVVASYDTDAATAAPLESFKVNDVAEIVVGSMPLENVADTVVVGEMSAVPSAGEVETTEGGPWMVKLHEYGAASG